MTEILTEEEIANLDSPSYWRAVEGKRIIATLQALQALQAQVNGLREALEFYAKRENHELKTTALSRTVYSEAMWDAGNRAKKALSRSPEDWREEGRLKEEVIKWAKAWKCVASGFDVGDSVEVTHEDSGLLDAVDALLAWEGGK